MAKRAAAVFTIMKNRILIFLTLIILGCDPVPPYNDIPWLPFDPIEVNLNLPKYSKLRLDGGSEYVDEGGVRGIILYRENALSFYAFERTCSWEPNGACATVDIDVTGLFFIDGCCGSVFLPPTGIPNGGPAIYPLNKYRATVNGSLVTITDELVN